MLISRNWLELLLGGPLPCSDAELGDVITGIGLEVEGVERFGEGLERVVVARVEGIEPHPQAQKLRLVQLHDGTSSLRVVCGADNVPVPGGKVAFAPVGVTLPNGLTLEARSIRGVESRGMICAEDELGIGPDASGILVLPSEWETGARLIDVVPEIVDTVYTLSITPNRPDALGHVGVARDLAVKLERTLVLPRGRLPQVETRPELVTLEAADRCGRYIGHAYDDVRVAPSPLWLRVRLFRLGLRPINNLVDITNLVLMEWGQPLHAFDRDRLAEGRVVVRMARPAEPMTTLDDRTLELDPDDLVIADAERPQALAGVMGGADSGVEAHTRRILLEAAWFAPPSIRRTARRHQIATDSSYRFERGVDHGDGLTGATARARELIEALAGGRCVAAVDVQGERPTPARITLRPARVKTLLGMDIPDAAAQRILDGIGVSVDVTDPAAWRCVAPTHRPDLQREVDLIEEVVRHFGLDALPAVASLPTEPPRLEISPEEAANRARMHAESALVDALRGVGLVEHVSFVFGSETALAFFEHAVPLSRAVRLANPMRTTGSLLRTHLLPGLLDALQLNVARHGRAVRSFELGRVYFWPKGAPAPTSGPTAEVDARLPREPRRVGILLSPGVRPGEPEARAHDARAMAGILLDVLARLGHRGSLRPCDDEAGPVPWLHPGVQARVALQREEGRVFVGHFGEIHPALLRAWQLPDTVRAVYGELDVEALPDLRPAAYRELPRFPATARDLSLEISITLPAALVVDALREAEQEIAASASEPDPPRLSAGDAGTEAIEVLEDYRGPGVPTGRRALLLRLHYRARERSVTDEEVQAWHAAVVSRATARLAAFDPGVHAR